jgi:putative tryptophan/tyrosine transport system substrate-binding protein
MARDTGCSDAGHVLVPYEFHKPDDFEAAFAAFVEAEALLVPSDTALASHRARIAELAVKARLPAIFANRLSAEAGGLLSYGPDPVENYRQAAVYVDKILKGAKPGDVPVERLKSNS